MSYRMVRRVWAGPPRGDVRDVVNYARQGVGFVTNPVGSVISVIANQLLAGLFGTSEEDLSIARFNAMMQQAYQRGRRVTPRVMRARERAALRRGFFR